ncbi:MAG TPA: hypothetical protein VMV10_08335 [Pirellulales bacterium]|nr:hypothetical protein [Pirellulales bacterium]
MDTAFQEENYVATLTITPRSRIEAAVAAAKPTFFVGFASLAINVPNIKPAPPADYC